MKKISSEILEKAEEAAKQYERAELFWNCSNFSDEEIESRRQRFLIGYEDVLKPLTETLFPKQAGEKEKKEAETYLQKNGLTEIVNLYQKRREAEETYHSMKNAERRQKQKEKAQQESMLDPSISEPQREGLRKFHQWMYRNCDRKGMKYFGEKLFGSDGSARNFADKFMSQPASVQLKALYLLEHDKRKEKDENGVFNQASQVDYVPDLDRLKDKMTATKWKVWKRTNGSYLYWNKLNEALEAAQTDEKTLLEFRREVNKMVVEHPDDYKTRPEFTAALDKLKNSGMEEGEKTGTFDKVSEVTDTLGVMNDDFDMVQLAGTNLETGIHQAKNSFQVSDHDEPDGYMTRLVDRIGGETAAKYYNHISSIGFSTLSAVSGVLSMYAGIKELKEGSMVQKGIGQAAGSLDIGTTGAYVAETISGMTGNIGEWLKASQNFVDKAGDIDTAFFGVASLLIAAKGGVDITSGTKGKSHAERAEKLGEELQDETIQNRAKFAKHLNQKEQNRGVRGFIQGSMGVTSATFALAASSVPIAGQAAGIVSISMGLYESYVQQNKDLQEKYRRGIDTELFQGGKELKAMDQSYQEKLKQRLDKLKSNPAAYKKVKELYDNPEKRYDILRKEKAVKNNSFFLRDCYEKAVAGMGDEAYRNVFYIDPNKKGTFDNLITKDNYKEYFTLKEEEKGDTEEQRKQKQEHNKQVKVRMSYKELMESFGTKVKFSSSKESGKHKLNETQRQEQIVKHAEEKRQKVADAFTKK